MEDTARPSHIVSEVDVDAGEWDGTNGRAKILMRASGNWIQERAAIESDGSQVVKKSSLLQSREGKEKDSS